MEKLFQCFLNTKNTMGIGL